MEVRRAIAFKVRLESGKTLTLQVRNILADSYTDMMYLALGIVESFIYNVYAKIESYELMDHLTDCDYWYDYMLDVEGWQDSTGFISSYKMRGKHVEFTEPRFKD